MPFIIGENAIITKKKSSELKNPDGHRDPSRCAGVYNLNISGGRPHIERQGADEFE
jgi:hypothetical protein